MKEIFIYGMDDDFVLHIHQSCDKNKYRALVHHTNRKALDFTLPKIIFAPTRKPRWHSFEPKTKAFFCYTCNSNQLHLAILWAWRWKLKTTPQLCNCQKNSPNESFLHKSLITHSTTIIAIELLSTITKILDAIVMQLTKITRDESFMHKFLIMWHSTILSQ